MRTLTIISAVLTACSSKHECKPVETKVYVDKPVPYAVYVPCKMEDTPETLFGSKRGSVGCWIKYTKYMINTVKIKYNIKNKKV